MRTTFRENRLASARRRTNQRGACARMQRETRHGKADSGCGPSGRTREHGQGEMISSNVFRHKRRLTILILAFVAALALTLASSAVKRTRLEVQEWDCPPAPASCARPVLVGGFPFSYISDNHGVSVVGRISLFGALIGEDRMRWLPFWLNVAIYFLIVAGLLRTGRPARPVGPTGIRSA